HRPTAPATMQCWGQGYRATTWTAWQILGKKQATTFAFLALASNPLRQSLSCHGNNTLKGEHYVDGIAGKTWLLAGAAFVWQTLGARKPTLMGLDANPICAHGHHGPPRCPGFLWPLVILQRPRARR